MLILVLLAALALSGCTFRTYQLTRDRIDQGITGNRGYIQGEVPTQTTERKTTRTTQVFEIELRPVLELREPLKQKLKKSTPITTPKPAPTPYDQEDWSNRGFITQDLNAAKEEAKSTYTKYTVQKGETLQKISQKLYGTTKKWKTLYDLNKDVLKGPNKVYPGQVINVLPTQLKEPKENLK
jgi:nucleoid-associated protein YgaU